jgi:hypothetical protein
MATRITTKAAPVKVGDRVRLIKATRHNMVPAGAVGEVVEIRNAGSAYTDGIAVEFLVLPSPLVARIFGKDP